MFQSGKSSETVNLMKSKRKKSNTNDDKCCDCTDAEQQTSGADKCPQNRDDTFSFTSCSLKKLLTSESPKIMMALIIIVGALTILLVMRCICCPSIMTDFAQERRDRRSDDAKDDRKPWETSKSRLMNEFSEFTGKDTKESNLHSGDLEYPEYMLPELSSILDPIKVNEGYGSNNLREFYRKLLKTDIQIKNLKKGITNTKRGNSLDFTDPNSSRLKRSLKIFTDPARLHDGSASLNKRSIENNKYYLSDAWKVDNDDKVLQDLDDLDVDRPDLSSPLEKAAEKKKLLMKQQKTDPEYTVKDKGNILNTQRTADDTGKNALEHFQFNHYKLFNALFGRERPSTQHRRLLQHEDDEDKDDGESEDYEDQTKEPWDREKRTVQPAELTNEKQTETVKVVKLPKTADSERKEPKPVYNDEINYMIEAAIRMATGKLEALEQKEKFPKAVLKTNKEYFEDIGNYDDLVEMAQAYSDYGVLDSKKGIAEKNKAIGNTIHLLATEKPPDILKQIYKIDNSLRGQRVKLKSNGETNPEKASFLKKFKTKLFSKGANPKNKHNIADTTAINGLTSKTANSSHFGITTPWNIFTQKKAGKHKERNVMYSGHRRSLKSVEVEELNDDATAIDINVEPNFNNTVKIKHNEDNTTIHVKVNTNNIDLGSINEHNKFTIINETSKNNAFVNYDDIASQLSEGTLKRNNTSWGLGELFGMFADFCMFLSGFDENQEESGYRFLYDFVTMLNPNYLQMKNKTTADKKFNDTRAPIEAPIDSEMVDNIGHRSRVLMSFEEKENSTPASLDKEDSSDPGRENRDCQHSRYRRSSVARPHRDTDEAGNPFSRQDKDNTNATKENKITNSSNIETKDAVVAGNRTVVKRSANGNVIFWNDLYDDEYGIKDPMEDDMKDKSSVKFNDLMDKDNWISNKFKILAKNLKERRNRKMEAKKNKNLKNSRNHTKTQVKRAVPVSDVSGKQMFEGLTANMKKVCHDAAQAIHESTNREVRADGNQASTLMQQLVSLMSELVDLQVRAKTCVQLPEDLRSFLAWLTSPSTEERDDIGFSVNSYDAGPNNLHTPDYDLMSTANARSDCLGTIHDVEDLILQYDEMSEEDKSKMSGVREYLEHQLHFLHKQLSSYNEYGSAGMYQDQPIRRRRQPNSVKKQRKIKTYKFLNYGRKHTRSTDFDKFGTEDYKSLNFGRHKDINEYYKQDKIKDSATNFENNDVDVNEKGNRKNEIDLKRNLKDDYYSGLVKNNDSIFKLRT